MGVISIVNGDYKATNITGAYHLVEVFFKIPIMGLQ